MSKFIREVAEKARTLGKCIPRGPLVGLSALENSFTQDGRWGEPQVLFAVAMLPTIGDELYKQALMQNIPVGEWLLTPPMQGDMFHQYQWYSKLLRTNVQDESTLDKLFTLFYSITDFTTEVARGS
jgi:hypothetical protein